MLYILHKELQNFQYKDWTGNMR